MLLKCDFCGEVKYWNELMVINDYEGRPFGSKAFLEPHAKEFDTVVFDSEICLTCLKNAVSLLEGVKG